MNTIDASNTQHVYPDFDGYPHNLSTLGGDCPCLCLPRVEQLCWLCGGENDGSAESDLPCSACGGTRWLPAYSDDADTPTVVIHNVVE